MIGLLLVELPSYKEKLDVYKTVKIGMCVVIVKLITCPHFHELGLIVHTISHNSLSGQVLRGDKMEEKRGYFGD